MIVSGGRGVVDPYNYNTAKKLGLPLFFFVLCDTTFHWGKM
jgi:hypothetical protein